MMCYTEGLHGINGWTIAVSRGVLRSMYCQHHQPAHLVQCDVVVNGLAVLAYKRSKQRYSDSVYLNDVWLGQKCFV